MATLADTLATDTRLPDHLAGTQRARALDRWIFVGMAVWFIAIILTGFIPDSLNKIAAVQAGERPPFPIVLHMHAALMGSFLLLLLAQTVLMATGRRERHLQLGVAAFAIVPALVIVGLVLVRTHYQFFWDALQAAPPHAREAARQELLVWDNILLLQLRIAILFPLFLIIGLRARGTNAGMHKRMMFLATAVPLAAAIDRIGWLPAILPDTAFGTDFYTILALSPLFIWDVARNRTVRPAYLIWLAVFIPSSLALNAAWNTPWWHSIAPRVLGF